RAGGRVEGGALARAGGRRRLRPVVGGGRLLYTRLNARAASHVRATRAVRPDPPLPRRRGGGARATVRPLPPLPPRPGPGAARPAAARQVYGVGPGAADAAGGAPRLRRLPGRARGGAAGLAAAHPGAQ